MLNKETLESIRKMAENHRQDVVRGIADQRSINTLILSFIIETINYELDNSKDTATQIYK